MAKFKLVVSDPETGKSKSLEVEGAQAQPLVGRRIGETVDGSIVQQPGAIVKITGGSDKDGTPIRPSVHGGVRTSIILSGGVGYHPELEGERKRKLVRGNLITDDIYQINLKVVEKAKKPAKAPRKAAKKVSEKPSVKSSTKPSAKPSRRGT